jgi:hypothetical protein
MCDFNSLSREQKSYFSNLLNEYARKIGGKGVFLQLLEVVRERDVHPLISNRCEFSFVRGHIYWDKVIFKDKIDLLMRERVNESQRDNFLPPISEKKRYKQALNLVKTFAPIVFEVVPKDESLEGFSFHAFENFEDDVVKLNPIFDAIFFCATGTIKKILDFQKDDS